MTSKAFRINRVPCVNIKIPKHTTGIPGNNINCRCVAVDLSEIEQRVLAQRTENKLPRHAHTGRITDVEEYEGCTGQTCANITMSIDTEEDSLGQKQHDDKKAARKVMNRIEESKQRKEDAEQAETVANAIDKTLNRTFLGWIDYRG